MLISFKNQHESTIKEEMIPIKEYGDIRAKKDYAGEYSESKYIQIYLQPWGGGHQI